MAGYLIYLFFFISFLILVKLRWKFIFYLPLFNLLADMSFSFFPGFSAPTIMRAGINLIFLLYVAKGMQTIRIRNEFYLFFAFALFMLLFSENFLYSFRAVAQMIISMSMLLAGYFVFKETEGFDFMILNLKPIIYIAIIATGIGYMFDIGHNLEYTTSSKYTSEAENVGLLGSGGMYAPGLIIGLLPLLIKTNKKLLPMIILTSGAAILYLLIILNVRRTAIIIPILGFLGFFIYMPYRTKMKILQYIVILSIGLVIAFPIYSNILNRRYEFRESQGRFEKGFYKSEGRYSENIQMFTEISNMDEPLKVFFGVGNNLFASQYENGAVVRRMIHSDIPKIFNGMGITGVLLYILIYIVILKEILIIPRIGLFRDLKSACLGLLFISVFVSINGSITLFSFRVLNFLLIGAILGYSRKLMLSYGKLSADKKESY